MKAGFFVLITVAAGMLAACGRQDTGSGRPDTERLAPIAQAIARGEDRVQADELAQWIVEGREDFMLVDVRDPAAFEAGHIETATNIPVAELVSGKTLATLPADRGIVLYSNGVERAGKATVLLRVAGYNGQTLVGGYNFWTRRVLNPEIPATAADDEAPDVARRRAIACYFAAIAGQQPAAPPPQQSPAPEAFTPAIQPAAGGGEEQEGGLIVEEGC